MARHHMTENGPVPFTPEEEAAWDAQEAAWEAGENDRKAEKIRLERNTKLAFSDWTQLTDSPVNKQAWADYRQALRDIPQQAGFPTEINWPEEPQ